MRTVFKIVLFLAFVSCTVWAVTKPGFDSIVAALITLGTLLGAFIVDKKNGTSQSQVVGKNSTAIQAGRDIKTKR